VDAERLEQLEDCPTLREADVRIRAKGGGEFGQLLANLAGKVASGTIATGAPIVRAALGRAWRENKGLWHLLLPGAPGALVEAIAKREGPAAEEILLAACPDVGGKGASMRDALEALRLRSRVQGLLDSLPRDLVPEAENEDDRRRDDARTLSSELQFAQNHESFRPSNNSRRTKQRRRALLAEVRGVDQPEGRGRRRGALGITSELRRRDLEDRFLAFPGDEQAERLLSNSNADLIASHASEHGTSLETARRDWRLVERRVANRVGYLTPLVLAGDERSVRREMCRVERLQRRVFQTAP
jgi:hypothetical protein